jgi:PAS domain S-box-containing protein
VATAKGILAVLDNLQAGARRSIAQSEANRYATLVNTTSDGFLVYSSEGRILEANDVYCRLSGFSREELLTKCMADLERVRPREQILQRMREAASAGAMRFETRHQTRAGAWVDLEVSVTYLAESDCYFSFLRDITERKRTEQFLAESRERFQLAVRGATDGVWDFNVLTGDTWVSDRWCELLGYRREELPDATRLTQWVFANIHPDDHDRVNEEVRQHFELRKPYSVEFRMRTKSGECRWFQSVGESARNPSGRATRLAGCLTDITERKRADKQLRQALDRLEATLQALPDLLFEVDQSGRICDYRAKQPELLAAPPEHFLGKTIAEILPPEAAEICLEAIREAADKGIGRGKPYRLVLADGEHWFELSVARKSGADIEASTFILLARDITDRKRAEEQLRHSKQRLRDILDSMFIFVGLFSVDGTLLFGNKSPFEAAQIDPADAIGRPFWDTYWWNYSVAVQEELRAAIRRAGDGETVRYDALIRVAGGRFLTIDITFSPMCALNGTVREIVGSAVDITQRMHAEKQAQRHEHELAHVLRVATMGEMATGIAHELNQPLGAIASYARAAQIGLNVAESHAQRVHRLLQQIEDQAFRAGEVVRRLRQLVNKAEPNRSALRLNETIGEVVGLLEYESRVREIRLELQLDDSLPMILGDRIQIQQVFLNLIRNAMDALANMPSPRCGIRIATSCEDGQVKVVVSDRGPGIAEEYQDRAFEPFVTTKPAGLGMGLPICRSIIESHRGHIQYAPTPGGGATFSIRLPIHDSPSIHH